MPEKVNAESRHDNRQDRRSDQGRGQGRTRGAAPCPLQEQDIEQDKQEQHPPRRDIKHRLEDRIAESPVIDRGEPEDEPVQVIGQNQYRKQGADGRKNPDPDRHQQAAVSAA